jgi:DNA repair exonuclease SbcCD ATPase subunit
VKAAGEEREVTLDELIKSYQLGTDYTQKTQTLAEQRKALEAERQAVEQAKTLRDQYAERLQAIQQVLAEQSKGENLEALKESDPIGYAVKVAELQQRREQLAAVQAEQQRIAYQQQAEQQQRLAQLVAEEQQKLVQAIPEFADPQKGEAVRGEIRTYAKQLGFTDQELAQVYDSRAVLTLWKAAQYDKLVSQKPAIQKKVTEAPKVLKPGTSRPVNVEEQSIRDQRKVLKKTGKARDAAAIFERFL